MAQAYLFWTAILSLACLAIYALDKRRAVRGGWRISERTLHLVALLGGWPGAWLAQRLFRHKTRKPGFRMILVLISGCHAVLICWWCWARVP